VDLKEISILFKTKFSYLKASLHSYQIYFRKAAPDKNFKYANSFKIALLAEIFKNVTNETTPL